MCVHNYNRGPIQHFDKEVRNEGGIIDKDTNTFMVHLLKSSVFEKLPCYLHLIGYVVHVAQIKYTEFQMATMKITLKTSIRITIKTSISKLETVQVQDLVPKVQATYYTDRRQQLRT